MPAARIPDNEAERLQALYDTGILDTPPEARFDRLTRLSQHLFKSQLALISLIDADRQFFKSRQGMDACEADRETSFCSHVLLENGILYVPDATQDPRFADNPHVLGGPQIRFYAGAPLRTSNGFIMGSFCVVDSSPRQLTREQLQALRDLADCAEAEINQTELRQQKQALNQAWLLAEAISRAQAHFIQGLEPKALFEAALQDILVLSGSARAELWDNGQQLLAQAAAVEQASQLPSPEGSEQRMALRLGGDRLAELRLTSSGACCSSQLERLQPLLATLAHLLSVLGLKQRHAQQEQRYQLTLESARLAAWDWELPNDQFSVSPRWLSIREQPTPRVPSRNPWQQEIHPDDWPRVWARLEAHWRGETELFEAEYRIDVNGQWRWLLNRGAVIRRSDSGQPVQMLGTEQDISRHKLAELSLQRSELRFRLLTENVPVGIVEIAPDGHWRFVNQTWCRWSGLPAELSLGLRWLQAAPVASQPALLQDWQQAIEQQQNFQFEFALQHLRSERWFCLNALRLSNELGELAGYLGSITDITDSRQGLQALTDSEHRYRALTRDIAVLIWTTGIDGRCYFCNDSWLSFTGTELEQALGDGWLAAIHAEDRPGFSQCLQQAVAQRQAFSFEYRLAHVDGSYRWVRNDASPSFDADGQFQGYVGACIDISQQKYLDQMKTEFISMVSHELRTPLTSISGALGLVNSGVLGSLPEPVSQMVRIAHQNSLRLSYLINDLLDMDKLVAGQMTFDLQPEPLLPLLERALDDNRSYGLERQVGLRLLPAAMMPWVLVDAQRLLQVLSNLLSNAIKFSPARSEVLISIERLDSQVQVNVRDFGPGVPQAFRSRIFQKFAQADSSDRREKGGTGLGLAISRELMRHLDGDIGFESIEGQGACFFIRLPVLVTAGG